MGNYTTNKELNFLGECAKQSKISIVEIGVLYGETTKVLLENSIVKVYGIDPIIPDSMNKNLIGSETLILNNTEKFKDRFIFHKNYSHIVWTSFSHEFDMVFIDGDHTYEAVKQDFEDWFSKLSDGGLCLIHDSAPLEDGSFNGHEGPKRLVEELKEKGIVPISTIDTINVYKKCL